MYYVHIPIHMHTYVHVYVYMWHFFFCFAHRNYEGRACTQHLISGVAFGPFPRALVGPLPIERSDACLERGYGFRGCTLHIPQTKD